MTRQFLKRRLAAALALLLVFSLLPFTAMAVDTGVPGLTASGNNKWTYSNGAITGSVSATASAGCTGTTYTANTTTLTFTNASGGDALLSFTYGIELNGGSAMVDGVSVTAGGTFSKELAANGTVAVSLTSNAADDKAATVTLSDLKLTPKQEVTVTFKKPVNGTCTVDDAAVNGDTTVTKLTTDTFALTATPASGYKFLGWYSETTGSYVGVTANANVSITESQTVVARFTPTANPVFQVGANVYTDLNEAVAYAQSSGDAKIALISNGTLPAGTYNIPNGKTLVIPFDEAQTVFTTSPGLLTKADGSPDSHTTPSAFRTLTMADGAKLVVQSGGVISVPSMLSAVGTGNDSWNGTPTGKHGRINMNEGSAIDVQSGGKLCVYGYISGSGSVHAYSGAEVWEAFQLRCWRGGSATTSAQFEANKVFPLSQYYVQNIEVPLTIDSGATEMVYAAVNAISSPFGTSATFIGSDGLFVLTSGSVTKQYIGAEDRLSVKVDGTFKINKLDMTIKTGSILLPSIDMNTESFVLPITNNISITIMSGSSTVGADVAFLPGSELTIDQGATLTLTRGYKAYVYDQEQWGAYAAAGQQFVPVGYSTVNGTTAKRTAADLVDAKIDVNGTLNIAGSAYTTAGGANITSSLGTGKVVQATPGTETVTHQATQSGTSITIVDIPITAARLKNADGTFCETADMPAGTEIPYVNGVWGGTAAPAYTVTWKNADDTVLETDENVAANAAPEYNGATPTMASTDAKDFTFAGWSTEKGGAALATLPAVTGDVTYYAVYTETARKYTVTWKNDDGSVIDSAQVEYGVTPNHADATKAETDEYTYTFAGWTPAVTAVTGDATYTATFTPVKKTYAVKFVDEDGTVLQSADVEYGETPAFSGETPTKASTAQYDYSFAGWTPQIVPVTGPATYTAVYSETVRRYHVSFVWDNGVVSEADYDYGDTPTVPAAPEKDADAQYTYTFAGWSPAVTAVTGEATYTATYTGTLRSYTIIFDVEGERTPFTKEYGTVISSFKPADPTKTDPAGVMEYAFIGWQVAVGDGSMLSDTDTVTGDQTYVAVFDETERTYQLTWYDADGNALETAPGTYNNRPDFPGQTTPTKPSTAEVDYVFDGWNESVDTQAGTIAYTPKFSETTRTYAIHFVSGSDELQGDAFAYGATPAFTQPTPEKAADAQYTYEFAGWAAEPNGMPLEELPAVTGEATYYAVFTATLRSYTVTWNIDGAEEPETYKYGAQPSHETPTKAGDGQHTYTFAGWAAEPNGAVLSELPAVTGDAVYYAVFSENAVFEVIFQAPVAAGSETYRLLQGGETDSATVRVQPNYPSFMGWRFTGVTVTSGSQSQDVFVNADGVVTNESLNQAISLVLAAEGSDKNVTVTANYEQDEQTYQVTITYLADDTELWSYTTDPYAIGDAMKLSADLTYTSGGKTYYFDHWVVNNQTYSTNVITLRPNEANTYEAVAVYSEEETEAVGAVSIVNAYAETQNGKNKIAATMSWAVPEGCELVEAGFKVSRSESMENAAVKKTTLTSITGTYTLHVNMTGSEWQTIYLVAFVTYRDAQGNLVTLESNMNCSWDGLSGKE